MCVSVRETKTTVMGIRSLYGCCFTPNITNVR